MGYAAVEDVVAEHEQEALVGQEYGSIVGNGVLEV